MITLLFFFIFGCIIFLCAQGVLRHDAREELLACFALQKKAEEAFAHTDVRDDAREALAHAKATYTRVKWAPEQHYSWLHGNLFALREAAAAHAEMQEAMQMAAHDVAIALHVRNTVSAIGLQLKALERAFPGCTLLDTEVKALLASASHNLARKQYAQAEESAMATFQVILNWTDQLIEFRKLCRDFQSGHRGQYHVETAAPWESNLPEWVQTIRRQERERPGD